MYQYGVKQTLRGGSIVFGLSALFLLVAPDIFLDLLGITSNPEMIWAMRMIGVILVALAGNMWLNVKLNNAAGIAYVGRVMFVAAAGLGFLTIFIPVPLTPFAIGYAAIGFGFSLSYLINLIRK